MAAITFRLLTEQTTVHDLKLRGASTVAHQIDVTVGDGEARKRILIECKDYSKPVALEEVRSFSAVVDDLEPDAAYIVTTAHFTKPAKRRSQQPKASPPQFYVLLKPRTGRGSFGGSR